ALSLQRAQEREPVQARHHEIGDDDRGTKARHLGERFFAVARRFGDEAPALDELLQPDARRRIVFDNQHALGDGACCAVDNRGCAFSSSRHGSSSAMSFLHCHRRRGSSQAERIANLDLGRWQPICLTWRSGGKTGMRLLIFLTIAGLSVGACDREVAKAAAPGTTSATPVATAGRAEPGAPAAAEGAPLREVTIPAGTPLPVALETSIGSDTSKVEAPVHAHLTRPVVIHGQTVLPVGSRVSGIVTDATQSGRVKGRAHVAVRFDSLTPANADA